MSKIEVSTSIGTIIVGENYCNVEYPGVWIAFKPKGTDVKFIIAEAEVVEEPKVKDTRFRLRPYISTESGTYTKDGVYMRGKLSWNGSPFDERTMTLAEFMEEVMEVNA